jgi:hypothetical protein
MLWLGGFPALDVTTSTPDALCPPIEEARAAIQARVGEVRGDYHVEFALVRGVDGRQVLKLSVHEAQQPVLTRELSLDDAGCEDAAQAIALVLERYFDAVEKPMVAAKPEPIPVTPDEPPSRNSPPAVVDQAPLVAPATSRWRTWSASAGFLYDLELGLAPSLGVVARPEAFRLTSRLQFAVALEVAPFLSAIEQRVREQEISAFSVQTALSIPLVWRFERWSASLGPWAQLRFQRAEAESLTHSQRAYRAVPGAGGVMQLAWSPASRWTLGVGVAGGAQAASATSRFVLRTTDTGPKPVLVPETAFGQGQLTLALELE